MHATRGWEQSCYRSMTRRFFLSHTAAGSCPLPRRTTPYRREHASESYSASHDSSATYMDASSYWRPTTNPSPIWRRQSCRMLKEILRAEGNFGSWRETKLREFRELEKNEIKRISGAEQNSGNSRQNSLYHAVQGENADKYLIERLVKSWCRTSIIRDGVELNLKDILNKSRSDVKQILEEYADTNEFAIAMLSGKGFLMKRWLDSGRETFAKVDVNTKDVSYQHFYKNYPEVPQPLLVAVWAMNDFEGVDVLMKLGVDTSVLYTHENEDINSPKPVFFQLICGTSKPDDRIIQRILLGSDMTARDLDGQTILFKAIETMQSDQFIQALFSYGADISQRDCNGRTVRDYAEYLRRTKYIHVIDYHVMQIVRNFDIESLEKLIFSGYDHILDLTDEKGLNIMQAAMEKKTPPKELLDLLQKVKPVQEHMKKLLKAADYGSIPKVKSLISRKLAASQDKCGRTVLHRAILARSRDLVEFLIDNYPHIMNIQDNLGRTALHYMFLLMEGDSLADVMLVKGASKSITDAARMTPFDYQCERCGKKTFLTLKQEIEGMGMDVYLARTNFEKNLRRSIRKGDIKKVSELIKGLQMSNGNINRFAKVLFDCLDYNQHDIALFLIQSGMRTDIYKEYKSRVLSLTERAIELNNINVVQLLLDTKDGKVQIKPKVSKPAMPDFTVYGLV
ncbi:hypothetical protein ACJMK2_043973 [Sinanodonta woodiana]|uniref:Uncharacterized protein n=1 Tax=Sinanodonta woodiana TaxID=1069815 RepID=A0ABD3W1R7_SINWO